MKRREALKVAGAAIAAAGMNELVQAEVIDSEVALIVIRYPVMSSSRAVELHRMAAKLSFDAGNRVLCLPIGFELETLTKEQLDELTRSSR